jgi:hypothetical protein
MVAGWSPMSVLEGNDITLMAESRFPTGFTIPIILEVNRMVADYGIPLAP